MGKALRWEHFQNKGTWTSPMAPRFGMSPTIAAFTLPTKCAQFVPKSHQLGLISLEMCHPRSFSRPCLGPGLKTSGGGEGRDEGVCCHGCEKLGFHPCVGN
jgi:hypothetical protein